MSNKSGVSDQAIALPQGGGAFQGLGEKFAPDLQTGTGNFRFPLSLPPGRNGFTPDLALAYSTGHRNGHFGMGWRLTVRDVARKTFRGVPRYRASALSDADQDTFIFDGREDLVPIDSERPRYYQPRTEGLFARIAHDSDRNPSNDRWEVRFRDGRIDVYGGLDAGGTLAALRDPTPPTEAARIFCWKLVRSSDAFGNRVEYVYARDSLQTDGPHAWDELYLTEVRYVDYGDSGNPSFLVHVRFDYERRPDAFSDRRAAFEVRTLQRCAAIRVLTYPEGVETAVRTYRLVYQDPPPANGASMLRQLIVEGQDGARTERLPPLRFGYTTFDPGVRRQLVAMTGREMPAASLSRPEFELADLDGNGLPDILEMRGDVRYWRNLGGGQLDLTRSMLDAPAGIELADPGVQLMDADGDGRVDLVVTAPQTAGYYPLRHDGEWDRRSFRRFRQAPTFPLDTSDVRLVDLDGDGVIDVLRSSTRFECFFNRPDSGRWDEVRLARGGGIPPLDLSDPHVKVADMTGDGLQDLVRIFDGRVEYWPSLGHGRWGAMVGMRNSPRLPFGYDPRRVLVGDVDGDGVADIVYVDDRFVRTWINQSGNGWSDAIEIRGTPPVADTDGLRLADMLGQGVDGILWSSDGAVASRPNMFYLDLLGGVSPYLLNEIDNQMGAVTRVEYAASTRFYLQDSSSPRTRWRTTLPFPVQVVARVEVIDEISRGKLTTEYAYHDGYWDGIEREFRGFGVVDHMDTLAMARHNAVGLHGANVPFDPIADPARFAPPVLTRSWFHLGGVRAASDEWIELGTAAFRSDFWQGDPPIFGRHPTVDAVLAAQPTAERRRHVLRALRGLPLRTEIYARDDDSARGDRPYSVREQQLGVREEADGVFFPFIAAQRVTEWERGDDPKVRFSFSGDYDAYGQPRVLTDIACPRGWRSVADTTTEPFLATRTRTIFASTNEPETYIVDRPAKSTT
jgi:hypothetical protein